MKKVLWIVITLILSFGAFCFIGYWITGIIKDTGVIPSAIGDSIKINESEENDSAILSHSTVEKHDNSPSLRDEESTLSETNKNSAAELVGVEENVGQSSSFWIKYIDVGQGDSAIIQCDGHYMMIDGGPASASSTVYTILKKDGIEYLDYMIATHPDADHIGGLSGALNSAKVGVCYSPLLSHDTETFGDLVKYLNKQDVSLTVPSVDSSFQLGSAIVEIMGPVDENIETNNLSIVVKVTYGSTAFLFMGDAEIEEENSLIDAKENLKCDVIKIGHHGSKNSTSQVLLDASTPKYAVISVGKDNSYGHPTTETLDRLRESNIKVFRTDLQGDILCESNGDAIYISTEKDTSDDLIWVSGSEQEYSDTTRSAIDGVSEQEVIVPQDTTFVLNTNSRKFHLPTCDSVADISENNKEYTSETADKLIADGYQPCGRCNPYAGVISKNDNDNENDRSKGIATDDKTGVPQSSSYVLNTNTMKFHKPDCSSVSDMSAKNRKDVMMSREEIIGEGYKPCKRCNP